MSIFISIASYCDPLLTFTIERAARTARHPQWLHFGVVDQSPAATPRLQAAKDSPAKLSYLRIDPLDARGPCWARALAMTLYAGEDWFFQIDSHMSFDAGWDETLVGWAERLSAGRTGVAISAYPNPFVLENGEPVHQHVAPKVLSHVVKPGARFEEGHPVLSFEAHPVDSDAAVAGFHLGAGCLFAHGRMARDLPYDPQLYFHGEEQALALRLFTHGWDVFHIPALPVYHLYNRPGSGAPARPMHWDAEHDRQRQVTWTEREQRAPAPGRSGVWRSTGGLRPGHAPQRGRLRRLQRHRLLRAHAGRQVVQGSALPGTARGAGITAAHSAWRGPGTGRPRPWPCRAGCAAGRRGGT